MEDKKDGTSAAKLAFEQMTTADTVTFPITYTTDTPNRGLKLVILTKRYHTAMLLWLRIVEKGMPTTVHRGCYR